MAKNYTSIFEVSVDYGMYQAVRQGSALTLGFLVPLARNRWTWIVSNWTKLYEFFKGSTGGNQTLLNNLSDLNRAVQSYNLGNISNYLENTKNFEKSFTFLQLIAVSTLKLTPDEIALRDKEIDRVTRFEVEDFLAMRDFVRKEIAIRSSSIGLGDEDADRLVGDIKPTKKIRNATVKDIGKLAQLETLKNTIAATIYDVQRVTKRPPNLIASANANIDASSPVEFDNTFLSYFTKPFEISLEHMAQKYLGSRDKYFELVSVNNLKPPYVDEAGEKFELLAPAAVNNLVIASTRRNDVPVGTKIRIGSFSQREEARIVERVIFNENNTMILFLSGKQDLNRFSPKEKAYVRIFTPATTRTGEFIFIPVPFNSATPSAKKTPSSDILRRLSRALRNVGVDIYRDQRTGDFVFDPNGNFKVAAGYDNVRQTVLHALKRRIGELPFHPDYGVNTDIGGIFFGTKDEAVLFGELLRSTILKDARFEQVLIQQLSTTGRSISLKLLVKIAGTDQFVPLAFVS